MTMPFRCSLVSLTFSFVLVFAAAAAAVTVASNAVKARVLVVGGSGRVGGSALRSLLTRTNTDPSLDLDLTAAGRSSEKWNSYATSYNIPDTVKFVSVDIASSSQQLDEVISQYDLIVHTAGPFQQLKENVLLKTSARLGKKYIDVLDDVELSRICRGDEYQNLCKSTGASAVISTGIWPGCSSLLHSR